MAKITGDGLATSSRDVYAQSECCVHCVAVIHYNHNRNRVLLYYLFQANKSFGTGHHLHSSSDVREVVSSTVVSQCLNRGGGLMIKALADETR
jgi:hypothetical protein